MSEAARSRRDEGRYEPQMGVPGRGSASPDPLAELARLVGQDDPFRSVFRPAAQEPTPRLLPQTNLAEAHDDARHYDDDQHGHGDDAYWDHAGHDHAGHHNGEPHADGHAPVADDDYYAAEQAAHPDEAGLADQRFAPGYDPAALPDMWAQDGVAPAVGVAPDHRGSEAPKATARRPIAVLAAVLLLTGGGLAASFLAKSSSGSGAATVSGGHGAPTILAASGPTKVKVDDGSATAPEDQDVALLNKGGVLPNGAVKIVSSQEQPADLGQLPKSDLADGARPLPPPAPSPFPEPKKVKTFLVHPDGTMLSGDPGPTPVRASVAAPAPATAGDAAAQPATPSTATRGAATPRSSAATPAAPAPTIASLSADLAPADATSALSAPAAVRQPPAARSGSSYGVQLASSPVEAEANAAFARLKKKYPKELGRYSATVHKAETGDKPVYRVRVGGMTQEEAKGLCTQLQSAGGSCLVMHN